MIRAVIPCGRRRHWYRQVSNIRRSQSKTQMFLVSSCSCICPIHWSQMLSWEWRCSWSSADRRCPNYIWVINNFMAYEDASYIRYFTVIGKGTVNRTYALLLCYSGPRFETIGRTQVGPILAPWTLLSGMSLTADFVLLYMPRTRPSTSENVYHTHIRLI